MRKLIALGLYLAFALPANAGDLADLRTGDMRKLRVHTQAQPFATGGFETAEGQAASLAPYKGKVVLVNFWATWCAPCLHEMPHLSALQTQMGGDDFAVVTIATGRNPLAKMQAFFAQINVDNLPLYKDPLQRFARQSGVLGLPVTLILDRGGNEIARMQGDADWSSDSARAIIQAAIDM